MHAKTILSTAAVPLIASFFVSCSSGPSRPAEGTPAFYWDGAKETFAAQDYVKTIQNLNRAARSPDFAPRAEAWALVIQAGLVRGYSDMADTFDKGARANTAKPAAFRKQSSNFRRAARPLTLEMAEKFRSFQKANNGEIPLAFPFPSGSQAEPPLLATIAQGTVPLDAQLDQLQKLELARTIILTAADVAGAGEDSSKALDMFKTGGLKVPHDTFMLAMVHALVNCADLFGPKRLDEPDRAEIFGEMAQDTLKNIPTSLEVKALNERISKILKASKRPT